MFFFVHMPRGIAIGLEDFFATKKYEDWMRMTKLSREIGVHGQETGEGLISE